MTVWQEDTLKYYYQGVLFGEYPQKILRSLPPLIDRCRSMLDICSGPGAFALQGLIRGMRVTAIDTSAEALAALTQQAGNYPQGQIQTITADFTALNPPAADMVVAACCFSQEMAEKINLQKIINSAHKLVLLVMHDGRKKGEFATGHLPAEADKMPCRIAENNAEEIIAQIAQEQGLTLSHMRMSCDFGCFYCPTDSGLLDFISRKTAVFDRDLLQEHLAASAIEKDHKMWLPNPVAYKVYWLIK
jgi:predicted RNA methylase